MSPRMDLSGKICLITGGASGIGKSLVQCFLRKGCKCFFVDIQYRVSFLSIDTGFPLIYHFLFTYVGCKKIQQPR